MYHCKILLPLNTKLFSLSTVCILILLLLYITGRAYKYETLEITYIKIYRMICLWPCQMHETYKMQMECKRHILIYYIYKRPRYKSNLKAIHKNVNKKLAARRRFIFCTVCQFSFSTWDVFTSTMGIVLHFCTVL